MVFSTAVFRYKLAIAVLVCGLPLRALAQTSGGSTGAMGIASDLANDSNYFGYVFVPKSQVNAAVDALQKDSLERPTRANDESPQDCILKALDSHNLNAGSLSALRYACISRYIAARQVTATDILYFPNVNFTKAELRFTLAVSAYPSPIPEQISVTLEPDSEW